MTPRTNGTIYTNTHKRDDGDDEDCGKEKYSMIVTEMIIEMRTTITMITYEDEDDDGVKIN
jgi:hypothetical protein